jgi:hypothetical protein
MKKITFRTKCLKRTISILPSFRVYANPAKEGWEDWAVEVGWICWYVGFKVEKL